jgi:hypothetical protein
MPHAACVNDAGMGDSATVTVARSLVIYFRNAKIGGWRLPDR